MKITLLLTGIQFGKSTVGAVWLKRHMFTHKSPDDSFIITAPNYKIMQQATLPAFLKDMEGEGEYHKGDALFKMDGGGTCYLRTATEPDSIVGITNVRAIWGDEAGKYSLYFWENIQARASFKNCPILLTTSPYTSNWLYKELLRPGQEGKRSDELKLIQASSGENPFFPKDELERRKKTMDPRRYAALYLGVFEKMHGLVYNCFDEAVHVVKPFELPSGTKYYAGVDWGYTDPFVLNVRAVTPNGQHFLVSEYYKTGMTINDMVIVARQKQATFGIEMFYAGPDQPGYIEEFNRTFGQMGQDQERQRASAKGAQNDIRKGIDIHYDLIKTNRYFVFESCKHTIDEYSTYHYPEPDELRPDDDSKEALPVGQDDHAMDAERYCSISTVRSQAILTPRVPESDKPRAMSHEKRIAMLKKGSNRNPGSERW